ncbi:methionyl-tRNA synthetase, putative [Medicago truncatula]|uniref:Methionyl-tRNA synthetase, putative n=1 Tax=Medicago truncatula TaxID=3880 RepID=G7JNZ1_MEDTR|nr:methionyl-tRNA synthetase, putative [Medicago truncatula]
MWTRVVNEIFLFILQGNFQKDKFDNKWLSERTVEQTSASMIPTCERFLSEYDSVRGDQCDKCGCGRVIFLNDLRVFSGYVLKHLVVCKNSPFLGDTDHLFLESWSQNAIQITNAWFKNGLERRCITRDLKWRVSVPNENCSNKSKGIGVFGNHAKDTNIPVEVSDTGFTGPDLQAKLNSELLNTLGNFVNQVYTR